MKRTPLKRKTPLKQKTPLKRKTPLRPVSKKRQRVQTQRRELVRNELEHRQWCEAGSHITRHLLSLLTQTQKRAIKTNAQKLVCDGRAVDIHEPLTRARGGSILDVENTMAVCRACHTWIHDNPEAATKLGLLKRA
tara:strand:- start:6195 stop:6602 length:408 start_codon:yes stop_codon:yes gene_type:complete